MKNKNVIEQIRAQVITLMDKRLGKKFNNEGDFSKWKAKSSYGGDMTFD